MAAMLSVRNESSRKRLCRKAALERLANRVCAGEKLRQDVEISLLLCDDAYMTQLNRRYRKKDRPTDVLSFEQQGPAIDQGRVLGDIVISLETAERNCEGDRAQTREEVDRLFCHGLLHLLGYDHATARQRGEMTRKQAQYLGLPEDAAWRFGLKSDTGLGTGQARRGGADSFGR